MPESVVYLGTIPVAEYGTPSTEEVPNAVKKHVHDHQGVLLENHGALTWGKDLDHAFYLMESLEFSAKINYLAKQLNGDRELSKQNVARLLELKKMMKIMGESPLGVDAPNGTHAKKIDRKPSLSEKDIDIIVERVTKGIIEAFNN